MQKQNERYLAALRKYSAQNFHDVLYIDLTADEYEVLFTVDPEGNKAQAGSLGGHFSDGFRRFADGPMCHENDRVRFMEFTDPQKMRETFEKSNYAKTGMVFRRKLDISDKVYSTVSMELYPEISEEGHIVAYLYIRSLMEDISNYNRSIEEEANAENHEAGKRTVLIVEDNEMNRELLAEILSEKYRVIQAENGAVGLEMLQNSMSEVSVVVLDVQMPVMNGYEFLKQVGKDPFLSRIPVVVATGSNSTEEESRCLSLGATDFVSKPYQADIIMSRLAAIIRLRESVATMSILQTDERTGLYTLQAFYYHARKEMDRNPQKNYTIIIFDIDRFQVINEAYGEETGDLVLQRVARVVKDYTAASDIYGRFGAARFLLLKENLPAEEADAWIEELFTSMKEVSGIKDISFKAGIYDGVDKALTVSTLCDRAITALNCVGPYFDKRYAHYDQEHAEREHRLITMESEMRDAYANEKFSVYYQPKHDAYTGKLVGAEALVRWIHPQYGFLSPGEFIPLFERNGFISYVDYYVLRRTCRNLKMWMEEGINAVPISVNASRRDMEREDFLPMLEKPLREFEIDPSMIHVEVTESVFSDRLDEMSEILHKCRDVGLMIEMDDFGAGYSSLTTLAALPLDVLKLDMSFMRNLGDDKTKKVLSTCVNLAKNLGLRTVSEGVETEEQLEYLRSIGCDWIQGYYYSKPLPQEEFKAYLERNNGKRENEV